DAATIFIALVICCVFLTARTRRRRSINEGIYTPTEGTQSSRSSQSQLFSACSACSAFLLVLYAAAAFLAPSSPANCCTASFYDAFRASSNCFLSAMVRRRSG